MNSTEYKVLVNKCNELIDKYNALCEDYDKLVNKHNTLCDYVDSLATIVNFLLVDCIEKIPNEIAKDMATKLKDMLASRLDKVSHAE